MTDRGNRNPATLRAKFALPLLLALLSAMVAAVLWLAPPAQAQEATADCGSGPLNGRTQKVVDAILGKLSETDCSAVTNTQLSGITGTLDLSSQFLASLQEGDFAGLSGMQTLYLTDNSLTALPEDVFDGLTSLQNLYASNNTFSTTLPEDVFDGLTSLKELSLGTSLLTTLPEDVFDGLTSLERVQLQSTRLAALPEDVFDGLTNLDELDLYSTHLTALPEDVFDGLTSLETLILYDNSLTALPEDVFDGLTNLKTLNLENNGLTALPEDVFDGLTSLETLNLDDNSSLSCIHAGQFDGLTELDILQMYGTSLGNIAPAWFNRWNLSKLTELRFGDTLIGEVTGSTLTHAAYQSHLTDLNASKFYLRVPAERSDPICGAIAADTDGSGYHTAVRVELERSLVYPNRVRMSGTNGDGVCNSDTGADRHELWTWQRSADGLTWTNVDPGRQPPDYGVRSAGQCSYIYTPHADDQGMHVRAFVPVATGGVGDKNYYSQAFGPLNLR